MIKINIERNSVTLDTENGTQVMSLSSPEAFKIISDVWLRCGWDTKYIYSFTWMGRPIIQLPEDMFRLQEVIYHLRPDFIIEAGVAHGGSAVFFAGLCKIMGKGKVIGIDIDIREHNRAAIEAHELYEYITLIEENSISPEVFKFLDDVIDKDKLCIVILDSNHSKEHVLNELRLFSNYVSVGSYIVAADGIMSHLVGAPRSKLDWNWNNPKAAAEQFVNENSDFVLEVPPFLFNEGDIKTPVTYWPGAWVKKVGSGSKASV